MKKRISVIVPVYNTEKYLQRCVQSILSQTYKDFELILVDDGSTDGSLNICKNFEAVDSRVRVISGANHGSSVARNIGLDAAVGEYLIFFDSDDWIELDMLSKMYTQAVSARADICACGFMFDDGKGKQRKMLYPYQEEKHRDIYLLNSLYSSVWNKLVRRSLFSEHHIRFIPGVTVMDDWAVTTRLRFYSQKTVVVNECLYHYYNAPRISITMNSVAKYPHSQMNVVDFLEHYFCEELKTDETLRRTLGGIKLRAKYSILKYQSLGGVVAWKQIYRDSHKYILSCNEHYRTKIIMLLAIMLPSFVFCRIAYKK